MEIIYLLIPLALILVTVVIWVFLWAIKSGQFDDLEGPGYQILQDDEQVQTPDKGDKDKD